MRREVRFPGLTHVRVLGIGSSGSNAINRMIARGIYGVDFVAVNTDSLALTDSLAATKVNLGRRVTRGLGCGGDMSKGALAAYESSDRLRELVADTDLLFIIAGMGRGTGTGAAPIIAEMAQELGILTIVVVTLPFQFEGRQRLLVAQQGIDQLQACANTLMVIPNDRLLALVDKQTSLDDAFRMADDVLGFAIQAISDLVTAPGLVNVDFADILAILSQPGATLMTVGQARGEGRARRAAEEATISELLNLTVDGASNLIVNITASSSLVLQEVHDAVSFVRSVSDPDVNLVFGTVINEQMGEDVRVTVIAKGFAPQPIVPPSTAAGRAREMASNIYAPAAAFPLFRQATRDATWPAFHPLANSEV